eukprot:gnl/TRDRNA2_/TRDRNA2_193175_c0_seq1.p1 gnl/TRDRNA2_/TRDRNA2_193175_c0~~gnl/TRDRNA2_/TRDRNA2_193175_c0_seq1.p1  ORF type:complete len:222 (-),score=24.45 gnl/TRDRNA2_/TRDRNA2_193175_c0_seq1:164-829(-)
MVAVMLLVGYFAFILVFAIGVCWLWPDFVDSNEPPRVRTALHCILAFEFMLEFAVFLSGMVKSWLLPAVILCNGWGMLDAFLRYPIVHDIDSLFGMKQVCLLTLKLLAYSLAFVNISKHVGWFVLCVLAFIFTVPILWLTALPIGDIASYHAKTDSVDVDIAVRLWNIALNPTERAQTVAHCKLLGRHLALKVAQVAPFMKPMVCRVDPALERHLSERRAV